jgi:archaellum component FlaC
MFTRCEMSSERLTEIRDEIRELRRLYQDLAERLLPFVEATPAEAKAIKHREELVDEDSIMRRLK